MFENGHKYTFEQSGNLGTGGGSPDLTNHERELAEEAIDQFEKSHGSAGPSKSRIKSVSVSIILILLGLFGLIFPQATWYLQIGWRLRESEPSDLARFVNRAIGGLLIIIGFISLI